MRLNQHDGLADSGLADAKFPAYPGVSPIVHQFGTQCGDQRNEPDQLRLGFFWLACPCQNFPQTVAGVLVAARYGTW